MKVKQTVSSTNLKLQQFNPAWLHPLVAAIVIVGVMVVGVRLFVFGHAENITTYYVSSSGSDKNDGLSPQTAWKTISKVDSVRYQAGDSVLFEGGDTFSGQLYFSPGESGTAASPITLGTYGSGPATINAGNGNAVFIYDAAGFKINNLNLVGSGASSNSGSGINIYNDLSGNTVLDYLYVTGVTASGFVNGLALGGYNGGSGFSNVTVTYSTFHDNKRAGLVTYGPAFNASSPVYANHTVLIDHVTAYNNLGDSSLSGSADSGNGIILGSVNGGTIRRSVAYNNGAACVASACGVGIWAYDATDVQIQRNVSHDNHTGSGVDGDGFDFDQNVSHSTMQHNYSYNNDGAGYLLFGKTTNSAHTANTVRFNISQNDGRKNGYGGIHITGGIYGDAAYNNTVYISPTTNGSPSAIKIKSLGAGVTTVRNNILYATGGLLAAYVGNSLTTAHLEFQQNDYYPFSAYWGGKTFTSLSAWRSATGQEVLNASPTGSSVDPELNSPGNGTLTNPDLYAQLSQYQLRTGSPMKNTGLKLSTLFNINIGAGDFFGVPVPTASGLSVGAAE